jgi:hypothetical protein
MGTLAQAELLLTVDFYGGLRCTYQRPATTTDVPDDYAALTVTDTFASATVAANLNHTIDGGAVTRQVLVIGGSAAGSGLVSDGTDLPGPAAVVSDTSITTYANMLARARAEMSRSVQQVRGSFTLEAYTPTPNVHPGSRLVLTDAAAGATGTYRISQIGKRFNSSGTQEWDIAYGGSAPSYVDTIGR